MKVIETEYKGYRFRSRSEARWAVFFDACGVDWEYEPEGYQLDDGTCYLPDFLLHGVQGRSPSDLYVEVKGNLTEEDRRKIELFSSTVKLDDEFYSCDFPILVVGNIPPGDDFRDIENYISDIWYESGEFYFSFTNIDCDDYAAFPCVNPEGKLSLVGYDYIDSDTVDEDATVKAFKLARQARFEHD